METKKLNAKSKTPITDAVTAAIATGEANVKPDKPVPAPDPVETPYGKRFVALMVDEYKRDWGKADPHVIKFFKRVAPSVEKLNG